jgi:hypothetical protein
MKILLVIVCMAVFMFYAVANAVETTPSSAVTCQKGSLARTVEVTYAGQQGEPPCEVHYKKTVEEPGHDQVLWNSEHTKDYCETKKQEFVAKLSSWGWSCQ